MAPGQLASMLNVRPLSRASLAPTGETANCGRAQVLCPLKIHCGSEPAREGAGSACINAECQTAIASKLGSHRRRCELRPGTRFMRSEARRVGKECVSTCSLGWSPDP